eukprot:Skav212710  [mRNA]  locus=scaffold113:89536:95923:- [translate_table: standard]
MELLIAQRTLFMSAMAVTSVKLQELGSGVTLGKPGLTCRFQRCWRRDKITFAGNWPTNARPVMEKVSHAFVIFFVLYITVIAFAVIRVISAVFLKDTLDAAQNDAEHLVVDRLRKKAEYVEKCPGNDGNNSLFA